MKDKMEMDLANLVMTYSKKHKLEDEIILNNLLISFSSYLEYMFLKDNTKEEDIQFEMEKQFNSFRTLMNDLRIKFKSL